MSSYQYTPNPCIVGSNLHITYTSATVLNYNYNYTLYDISNNLLSTNNYIESYYAGIPIYYTIGLYFNTDYTQFTVITKYGILLNFTINGVLINYSFKLQKYYTIISVSDFQYYNSLLYILNSSNELGVYDVSANKINIYRKSYNLSKISIYNNIIYGLNAGSQISKYDLSFNIIKTNFISLNTIRAFTVNNGIIYVITRKAFNANDNLFFYNLSGSIINSISGSLSTTMQTALSNTSSLLYYNNSLYLSANNYYVRILNLSTLDITGINYGFLVKNMPSNNNILYGTSSGGDSLIYSLDLNQSNLVTTLYNNTQNILSSIYITFDNYKNKYVYDLRKIIFKIDIYNQITVFYTFSNSYYYYSGLEFNNNYIYILQYDNMGAGVLIKFDLSANYITIDLPNITITTFTLTLNNLFVVANNIFYLMCGNIMTMAVTIVNGVITNNIFVLSNTYFTFPANSIQYIFQSINNKIYISYSNSTYTTFYCGSLVNNVYTSIQNIPSYVFTIPTMTVIFTVISNVIYFAINIYTIAYISTGVLYYIYIGPTTYNCTINNIKADSEYIYILTDNSYIQRVPLYNIIFDTSSNKIYSGTNTLYIKNNTTLINTITISAIIFIVVISTQVFLDITNIQFSSKNYDGTNYTYQYSSNLQSSNGDTVNITYKSYFSDANASLNKIIYMTDISCLNTLYYTYLNYTSQANIIPASLLINYYSKSYDSTTTAKITLSGIYGSDIIYYTANFADPNVGNKLVNVSLSNVIINYTLSNNTGYANITPASLFINYYSKLYDSMTTAKITLSGIIGSDIIYYTANFADPNVGNKLVNVSLSYVIINYALSNNTGYANITPASLFINYYSKLYDSTTTAKITLSGIIGSDIIYYTANFADPNVGNKLVNVSLSNVIINYALSNNTGYANITPASLFINYYSKLYDSTTTAKITLSGIYGSDIIYYTANFADPNVGNKLVNVSLSNVIINYLLLNKGLTYYLYANNPTGSTGFGYGAGSTNLAYFDTASITLSGIVLNLYSMSNITSLYSLNFAVKIFGYFLPNITGTWTFSITADDLLYFWIGDNALNPTTLNNNIVVDYFLAKTCTVNLISNIYYPILILWGQSFGGYQLEFTFTPPNGINISDGTGYYFTKILNTTANIYQAPLIVNGLNKSYDSTTTAKITISGIFGSDIIYYTANFADPNVGNKLVNISLSNVIINYILTNNTTYGNIIPASLLINYYSKSYDSTTTAKITLSGIYGSDIIYYTANFADPNVGNKLVNVSLSNVIINYALSNNTGYANIIPKLLYLYYCYSKLYDTTTRTYVTISGILNSEIIIYSANFVDSNVGTNKLVNVSLSNVLNYTLSNSIIYANIYQAPLLINTFNKIYDGTISAQITISGLYSIDYTYQNIYSANFVDKNVGTNKTVNIKTSNIIVTLSSSINLLSLPFTNSFTLTISDQIYTINQSSNAISYQVWQMFDKSLNTFWHCGYYGNSNITYTQDPYYGYYQGGGIGAYFTTNIIGVGNIAGEWIQIQYPYSIQVSYYTLYPRSAVWDNRFGNITYLVGSNDGTNWYLIKAVNLNNIAPSTLLVSYNSDYFGYYTYIRLVINAVGIGGNVIHFAEMNIYTFQQNIINSNYYIINNPIYANINQRLINPIFNINKTYDNTTNLNIIYTLSNVIVSDNISINYKYNLTNQNAGIQLVIIYDVSNYNNNYSIGNIYNQFINILPATLTPLFNISKIYDKTQYIENIYYTLSGLYNDNISLSSSIYGLYRDYNIGNNILVDLSNIYLYGTNSQSYTINNSITTNGNINQKELINIPTNISKIYDSTTTVYDPSVLFIGIISNDIINILNYSSRYLYSDVVSNNKVIFENIIIDNNNYIINNFSVSGTILPLFLNIEFYSLNKIYDGNNIAHVKYNLPNIYMIDICNNYLALYNDINPGINIPINITNINLTGLLLSNYYILSEYTISGIIYEIINIVNNSNRLELEEYITENTIYNNSNNNNDNDTVSNYYYYAYDNNMY